jgi:hypothetical protein
VRHLQLWCLAIFPILKALWLKLFLTTSRFFPFNIAGIPLGGNLPAASGTQPGNEGFVLSTRVQLTSAQILALFTTPVTLVPAPGVGFRIVPVAMVIRFIGGSVAYLNGGAATVLLALGSAVVVSQPAVGIFLVTVAPNRRTQMFAWPGDTDVAANPPTTDNAALTLALATANLTAGNGLMAITTYYTLEPTT